MLKNFFPNKILSLSNTIINSLILLLIIVVIIGIYYVSSIEKSKLSNGALIALGLIIGGAIVIFAKKNSNLKQEKIFQ